MSMRTLVGVWVSVSVCVCVLWMHHSLSLCRSLCACVFVCAGVSVFVCEYVEAAKNCVRVRE